ncbi:MAG: hypothetical protein GOU98_02055 [Candidatus Altiarchaeota archaeon]|nr:hypothetical protein [Candidatus Altiarchaeota archaeon]
MENSIKGVIGVLVITGVIVAPIAQRIGDVGEDVSLTTLLSMIDTQTNLIKMAAKADLRTKNTAKTILEMGSLSAAKRALYPNTLTGDDIFGLVAFLSSENTDANFISDVFPHCQKWLIFAETGQTKFTATPDILEAYFSSITAEQISSLRPAARVSEALNNKATAVKNFCGSTCLSTISCGNCWELRQDFLYAQNSGNLDRILEVDTEIREAGCALSCADVCANIYNSLSLIASTSFMGINLGEEATIADVSSKIDFIDLGIGLP